MYIWTTKMLDDMRLLSGQEGNSVSEQMVEEIRGQLLQSGAMLRGEDGGYQMDSAADIILDTFWTWDVHMHCVCQPDREFDYYLKEDMIVYAEREEPIQKFYLLPAINYAIASVADMVWDYIRNKENDDHAIFCEELIDGGNYAEILRNLIEEEEYRAVLGQIGQEMLVTGSSTIGYPELFTMVKFVEGTAYYYRQEGTTVSYGKCSRERLVNLLCRWMLYAHRELISRFLQEGGAET